MLEFTDINKSLPNGQNMGGLTQEIYFGFHADVLTWPTAPVAAATLAANAILTGSVVVATNVAHTLVLEAKKVGILFTVRTFDGQFTQVLTTPFKKATYTDDDIFRLFAPHPDQAGQRVIVPTAGVPYACITINQKTLGYENVSASASTTRTQVINIYVPATAIAAVEFATATDSTTNANSMADTVGVKAKTIKDYLILLLGAGNVMN